ncbi:MAG: hypothetical protein KBC69_00510 [Candidatus Magasanikbacteria bacterium]|nr:hypothetical protein [Candidatus Magasanikbacteria bacterium]
MNYTHNKLTISGPIVEFDTMEKPIFYGTNYRIRPGPKGIKITTPEDIQLKSAYRSKRKVRLLVNANAFQWFKPRGKPYIPIFITFTFRLDMRDIDEANKLYTDFMQRLNYSITKQKKHNLHYLAVTEFQDENREGVIHYHTLFFNMRFIKQVYDEIKRIWTHGNTNVTSIKNLGNIAQYMVKYMTKSMRDGRLVGKKKYFTSKNLLKPKEIKDEKTVLYLAEQIPKNSKVFSGSWLNTHCGKITRTTYNLQNNLEVLTLIKNHSTLD